VQLLEIFAFVGNSFLSFFRFDESHSTFCLNWYSIFKFLSTTTNWGEPITSRLR
jgi:hypothetical protein